MIVQFIRKVSFEGGAGTFQSIFEKYLINKSCTLTYYGENTNPDVCFVISSTRHVGYLIYCKIIGLKIVQRLDGFNWIGSFKSIPIKNKVKMIIQNILMNFIRKFLADEVVYQSNFVKSSWEKQYGISTKRSHVIMNCAGEQFFDKPHKIIPRKYIITCVEGHIQDDKVTENILSKLNKISDDISSICDVEVYGKVKNTKFIEYFKNIKFNGHIDRSEISTIYKKNNRIYFCLEINPPCPNSLIEAIASQIPCVGFDTGSFKEIITDIGVAIPYQGNPWVDEPSNYSDISTAIEKIINSYSVYKSRTIKARGIFRPEIMCESYFNLLND